MKRLKSSGFLNTALIVMAAVFIYAVSSGIRSNLAVLMQALTQGTGLSYANVSLIIAMGQLIYGLAQPVFGILALKISNRFVLLAGIALMALGLAAVPFCGGFLSLLISLGLAFHAGTGATCFGIVMSVAAPRLGAYKAAAASGIINAATGIGGAVLSPMMTALYLNYGLAGSVAGLCLPILLSLPAAFWLCAQPEATEGAKTPRQDRAVRLRPVLRAAFSDRVFIITALSFITCGFHMSILWTHLFSQFLSYGLSGALAAFDYALLGLGTMAGAVLCGLISLRISLKKVLGSVYLMRAAVATLFVFVLPHNAPAMMLFALFLGLSCDASITPTAEIISRRFGPLYMGVLFGFAYAGHQAGAFASAALGGYFVGETGGYELLWLMDILLCLGAAVGVLSLKSRAAGPAAPLGRAAVRA